MLALASENAETGAILYADRFDAYEEKAAAYDAAACVFARRRN